MQERVSIWRGTVPALLLAAGLITAGAGNAAADVLDQIKETAKIRLAVRMDAPPFSAKGEDGKATGYSVALCVEVAEEIKKQLDLPQLTVEFIEVTAEDRFGALTEGHADLLCEATTATLARREVMDFSIPTFISGAGLVIRPDGPQDIAGLDDKKVGVLDGTTTEDSLQATLKQANVSANVVPVKTHDEGIAALEAGDVEAYFADRTILRYILGKRQSTEKLLLADNYLTIEPYALALPLGESRLRLAVDRALSHLYRSGRVAKIFQDAFGPEAKPTALQKGLYTVSGLPD